MHQHLSSLQSSVVPVDAGHVCAGEWVSSIEIENAASAHEQVILQSCTTASASKPCLVQPAQHLQIAWRCRVPDTDLSWANSPWAATGHRCTRLYSSAPDWQYTTGMHDPGFKGAGFMPCRPVDAAVSCQISTLCMLGRCRRQL